MGIYIAVTTIYFNDGRTIQNIQQFQTYQDATGTVIETIKKSFVGVQSISLPLVHEIEESELIKILQENGYELAAATTVTYPYDKERLKELIVLEIQSARDTKNGGIKALKRIARELDIDVEDM